jgi:hypothetical protein
MLLRIMNRPAGFFLDGDLERGVGQVELVPSRPSPGHSEAPLPKRSI